MYMEIAFLLQDWYREISVELIVCKEEHNNEAILYENWYHPWNINIQWIW
jgi:hypothetical protein